MRTLVGHRQNKYYSWRKTANSLPRRFSVNIYRTLPLSSVLAPIEKRFVRETFSRWECYICSLKVLYTDSSDRGNTMSMKNFLGIKSVYDDYKQQKRKKWARQVPWLACYWLRRWKTRRSKTSWSNQRQTRISLLYFSALSYYKSSVETNFPISAIAFLH